MLGWWRAATTAPKIRRHAQTGVRVLLLCKLEQMQREMVANDGIADNTAKRTAQLDATQQLPQPRRQRARA